MKTKYAKLEKLNFGKAYNKINLSLKMIYTYF